MSLLVTGCEEADRQSSSQPAPTAATQTPAAIPRPDADFDGDGRADLAFAGGCVKSKMPGRRRGRGRVRDQHGFETWSRANLVGDDLHPSTHTHLRQRTDHGRLRRRRVQRSRSAQTTHLSMMRPNMLDTYGSSTVPERLDCRAKSALDAEQPRHCRSRRIERWLRVPLAASNFGHGPEDDLAIGVHGENDDSGAVNVLYGRPEGSSARYNQVWSQSSPGIVGVPEQYDAFGLTLVTGRFRDSAYADLAIGVYVEHSPGSLSSGAVHVINGSADGLTASAASSSPNTASASTVRRSRRRPSALDGSRPLPGGRTDDLAVGAPFAATTAG